MWPDICLLKLIVTVDCSVSENENVVPTGGFRLGLECLRLIDAAFDPVRHLEGDSFRPVSTGGRCDVVKA